MRGRGEPQHGKLGWLANAAPIVVETGTLERRRRAASHRRHHHRPAPGPAGSRSSAAACWCGTAAGWSRLATCRALLPRPGRRRRARSNRPASPCRRARGAKAHTPAGAHHQPRLPVRPSAGAADPACSPAGRQPIELLAEDKNFNLARREAGPGAAPRSAPRLKRRGARQVGWVRYAHLCRDRPRPGASCHGPRSTHRSRRCRRCATSKRRRKVGGIQFRASKLETLAAKWRPPAPRAWCCRT